MGEEENKERFIKRIEDDDSAKLRRIRWILGLSVGLPVLLFALWSGLALQIWRIIFPIAYYSESFADITVDGQRYHLTSVAKCEQRYTATAGGLVHGGAYHTVKGGLLAKRLPSGEGIIIKGPYLCSEGDEKRLLSAKGERTFALSRLLAPRSDSPSAQIMKLNDVKSPSRIKLYRLEHFKNPESEIQIHQIGYRETDSREISEPADEIPWLKDRPTQLLGKCSKGTLGDWYGFYVEVANKSIWSSIEGLSHLSAEEELTVIEFNEHTKALWAKMPTFNIKIIPNEMLVDLSTFGRSKIGIINYYKKSDFQTEKIYVGDFFISNSNSRIKNVGKWVYDPEYKILFYLHRIVFEANELCR